jgi:hypothetical protein
MIPTVLRVVPENGREKWDPKSLVNFETPCTVQHNYKVRPIGRLSSASLDELLYYYHQECIRHDEADAAYY